MATTEKMFNKKPGYLGIVRFSYYLYTVKYIILYGKEEASY